MIPEDDLKEPAVDAVEAPRPVPATTPAVVPPTAPVAAPPPATDPSPEGATPAPETPSVPVVVVNPNPPAATLPPSTTGEGIKTPLGVRMPVAKSIADIPGLTSEAQALMKVLHGHDNSLFPTPKVISGFRDPDRNAAVGGARDSEHTRGNAVDVDVTGWTDEQKKQFIRLAINSGARGVGIYPSGNSIHLDVRSAPMIWGMSARGPYRSMDVSEAPQWAQEDLRKLVASEGDPSRWRPNFAPDSIQAGITGAASRVGLPPAIALAIAGQESTFNPNARNTGTDARGLFQMIPGTRKEVGLADNASVAEQIEKGVGYVKAMYDRAKGILGREPTAGEVYTLHYQGPGGGAAILRNPSGNFIETLNNVRPDFNSGGLGWGQFVVSKNPWLASVQTNQQFIELASTKMSGQLNSLGAPGRSMPTTGSGRSSIGMSDVRAPRPISAADEAEMGRMTEAQMQRWSWWQTTREALSNESALGWLSPEDSKFIGDPNFRLTKDSLKKATEGLDQRFWPYFERARSDEHLTHLRTMVDKEVEYEKQLAAKGIGGTALRMGAAVLDPAGWLLVAATSPVIGGAAKFGPLGRTGILATEGAASATILGIPQFLNRPGQELDDLILTGAMGAAFGSAFGMLGKPAIHPDIAAQTTAIAKQVARDYEGGVSSGAMGAAANALKQDLRPEVADVLSSGLEGSVRRPAMGAARKPLGVGNDAYLTMEDLSSALGRSETSLVAAGGERLVQDAVGAADKNMVNRGSVSELMNQTFKRADAQFMSVYKDAYMAWEKANHPDGVIMGAVRRGGRQAEFNEMAGRAARSTDPFEVVDPNVAKVVQSWREMAAKYNEVASNPGLLIGRSGELRPLRGWEDGPIDIQFYVPRFVHWAKFQDAIAQHGDVAIARAVSQAIRKVSPQLDKELSHKLGETWVRKHREVQAGMNGGFHEMVTGRNLSALRETLANEGYDAGEIYKITEALKPRQGDDAGAHARGKHRQLMDETHAVVMPDGSTFRIDDMFDTDLVRVSRMYNRQMAGQVSMATFQIENPRWLATQGKEGEAISKMLVDNITSKADWDNYLDLVRAEHEARNIAGPTRSRELAQLQRVYDLVVGTPHALEGGNTGWAIRQLQNLNFARVMNQVGFAQLAEAGNVLGQAGFRAASEAMPMFNRLVLDAQTGQMDAQLARELTYMTAAGTDWVRSFARASDEAGAMYNPTGYSKTARVIDEGLSGAARVTSAISLMEPINAGLQKLAVGAAVARFANMAGEKASMSTARLRYLGLDETMTQRVLGQIKEHSGRVRDVEGVSGANINALNLDKWEPQARAAFETAVWRWSNTMIQTNDIGQLSMVMSNPIGKLFFQFRSFMLAAYTKQTLHSLHMRDFPAFASFTMSMVFGGLAYSAQTYLQSIGRSDQEKFLTEKLGDDEKGSMFKKLAAASFQRAGAASLIPAVTDQGLYIMGQDPLFAARSTSLPSQGLVANPTLSLIDNMLMGTRSLTHGEFSQTDARKLASLSIWQNFLPFQWTYNSFISDLPEKNTPR